MRVAVDATALLDPPTGIGVFTAHLLRGLGDRPSIEPIAYASSWRGRHRLADAVGSGIGVATRPLPARPSRWWWTRAHWPTIDRWTGAVDLVHGPNFVVPPARSGAEVVTVHDLTTVHHPEMCDEATLDYPALVQRAIDRGAFVHTVSDFVADEVRDHFDVEGDRVVAVHNGVDRPERPQPNSPSFADAPPYILALGTIEPRKDLAGLVAAFDLVAADDPDLRLVVAGQDGWGIEAFDAALRSAGHRDRIDRIGYVDDARRARLLDEALLLAYPSRYEGFGLPPLEAMAAGTPVVATRAGALPEVLGDAAELVPVGDIEALAAGLARVVEDDAYRSTLIERGSARSEQFSWADCVDGLVGLYDRAVTAAR